jgi:sortase A
VSKSKAEDFVTYLKQAVQSGKEGTETSLKKSSERYIQFEKAGSSIGLLLAYDSEVNDFYFIDESGYIVIDFQNIIKQTDIADKYDIPAEIGFTFAMALCIIGVLINFGRWGEKIRGKNKSRYEDEEENENELEVANRRTRRARYQTFSYKVVKQVLRYCFVPIIMGFIVLIAGIAVLNHFSDITVSVQNNFVNTQPIYVESNKKFVKSSIKKEKQEKSIQLSDITMPKYGEQYGLLTCEKLKLSTPVFFGDRGNILQKGAGQYSGSFFPGEGGTILIGAHDTTYFKNLENVEKNQIFEFTTEYGIYEYKVTDIKIYDEAKYDKAYDLSANKEQLILYTCYPFGKLNGTKTQRMFVYLDKINGPDIKY